jgi:hypothetical protein
VRVVLQQKNRKRRKIARNSAAEMVNFSQNQACFERDGIKLFNFINNAAKTPPS